MSIHLFCTGMPSMRSPETPSVWSTLTIVSAAPSTPNALLTSWVAASMLLVEKLTKGTPQPVSYTFSSSWKSAESLDTVSISYDRDPRDMPSMPFRYSHFLPSLGLREVATSTKVSQSAPANRKTMENPFDLSPSLSPSSHCAADASEDVRAAAGASEDVESAAGASEVCICSSASLLDAGATPSSACCTLLHSMSSSCLSLDSSTLSALFRTAPRHPVIDSLGFSNLERREPPNFRAAAAAAAANATDAVLTPLKKEALLAVAAAWALLSSAALRQGVP
mmetsp:Transcript_4336/g.8243  ORF Transcript_4336/g.8243 Transcript_4336/m.8243 type:complete len:280 (-) Transcript_4336:296-1135(-)